jgi:hypothetical protein
VFADRQIAKRHAPDVLKRRLAFEPIGKEQPVRRREFPFVAPGE